MRILGLIPARGGSKGIPGKNIKLLDGKPLLRYTTEAALGVKGLTDVILSTDDLQIAEAGRKAGVLVPFMRPSELAEDSSSTISVIVHALEALKLLGKDYDAVCVLQVTTPFRQPGFIDQAIHQFEDQQTDSLISVLKVPHEFNPHWTFERTPENTLRIATGEKKIITRRQELPDAYYRDGSLYLTRCDVILSQNSIYGQSIGYIEGNAAYHVNLDTMEDWEKAESILKRMN
jgi:CMP-N,N'-diacetyllegionaminic acid synthase